jgi:hypothetical protein
MEELLATSPVVMKPNACYWIRMVGNEMYHINFASLTSIIPFEMSKVVPSVCANHTLETSLWFSHYHKHTTDLAN